jgi:DNA polymerase III subunit beta
MKIILMREKLKEILDIVTNICPKKSDLSILNYFFLKAEDKEIYIASTDLEISYQTTFPGRIEKEGQVLIPAKQFEKIIENFYEDEVILEAKGSVLEIKGENIFSSLPGLKEEEFPTFSEIKKDKFIEFETEIFDIYIDKLWPILTTAEIKPEYNGISLRLKEDKIILVATDTIRLGEEILKSQFYTVNNIKPGYEVLIPKRILQEYRRVKRKTGKLKVYFEENQISFEIMSQIFTTKLFSVEYPPYEKIKPSSFILSFEADRRQVINALKLNKVFMDQFKELEFKVNKKENKLELYSKNELLGENRNEIKINNIQGDVDEITVKFNLDFLLDGFSVIESDNVFCGFFTGLAGESTPILLRPIPEEDFIYILMHYG